MADSIPDIEWYDGAASGQQRSALMRLQPDRLMISHATACHYPWDNQYQSRDDYTLFVDSGGYSHLAKGSGEFESSYVEYLRYIEDHEPAYWALRDYPCEPDLLEQHDRTVEEHQRRTLEDHLTLLEIAEERGTPGQPVPVLQGWDANDYLLHFETFRDHGIDMNYLGVGSVCRRLEPKRVAGIIETLGSELPDRCELHAFGVKNEVLQYVEVLDALRSADSSAYAYQFSCVERDKNESFTFRDAARGWLTWRRRLREIAGTRSLHDNTKLAKVHGETVDSVADRSVSDGSVQDRTWSNVLDRLRSNGYPFKTKEVQEQFADTTGEAVVVEDTLIAMSTHGWLTQQTTSNHWVPGPTAQAEFNL